jgi:transposase
VRRSKLTDEQTRRLLEHFVAGTPARTAAELVHVNRNTARLFYHKIRELIAQRLERENPLENALELDEPAAGEAPAAEVADPLKVPVFALVKRGDKVLTVMVPERQGEAQPSIARSKVRPDSIVYTASAEAENELDVADLIHQRVPRRAHYARGRANLSSTENFWNQAKRHLRRYNGVPRQHLHLFLKECEWRFNYGPPKQLLRILKYWVRAQSRHP